MKNQKRKRTYRRKYPECGKVYEQSKMIRTNISDTGWLYFDGDCEDW